ncbi:MAG: hypothetical protein FJ147_09495 [Deltaproteobacteria bacterium]|nr:hypothetical protein [Deltaproteobacteria bacterium]
MIWLIIFTLLCLQAAATHAAELTRGARAEFTHAGKGHEVELSGTAVAAGRDGDVFMAWARHDDHTNNLYVTRFTKDGKGTEVVRVNPDGMAVDSLHQSPDIALGTNGEIYVSWSSAKAKPEGTLFASDVRLSRSLDGGQRFDSHLRINEDRPISHSFEDLAVTVDGTVVVSWIDTREGWDKAGTYLARVGQQGSQLEKVVTLGGNTCVCCRSHVTTGPNNTVAVLWRTVFPTDIRDMTVRLSSDGGLSFSPTTRVHKDRWQLNACPHRGGTVGIDAQGRVYTTWYTEGAKQQPAILFATSKDGKRFSSPLRLDTSRGSVPDHVRMATDPAGRTVVVWEDSTAVHRRVLMRYTTDGGRTFSAVQSLSPALKAYAPDLTVSPSGVFVIAWHEEQFPLTKTIIQTIQLPDR